MGDHWIDPRALLNPRLEKLLGNVIKYLNTDWDIYYFLKKHIIYKNFQIKKSVVNEIIEYFKKADLVSILKYRIEDNTVIFYDMEKIKDINDLLNILKNKKKIYFVLHSHEESPKLSMCDINTLSNYPNMILGIYIIEKRQIRFFLIPYVILFEGYITKNADNFFENKMTKYIKGTTT